VAVVTVGGDDPELRRRLDQAWRERRLAVLGRLATIEAATVDADAVGRRAAAAEAHKLAGSLGSFGRTRASRLARRAEQLLTAPRDDRRDAALRDVVSELADVLAGDDREA
jgi:HPt (histidine-containing phosphotransfer) domain-containing protein